MRRFIVWTCLIGLIMLSGCSSSKDAGNRIERNITKETKAKEVVKETKAKDTNVKGVKASPLPSKLPRATPTNALKNKNTPMSSNAFSEKYPALKGKKICIDAGHQSKGDGTKEPVAPSSNVLKQKVTSGTRGVVTGISEYELNLAVAKRLKDELQKAGALVVMVRETNHVNISNIERARFANKSKADLVIRIHADGDTNQKVAGISVLCPGKKYISDQRILRESKSAAGKVLTNVVAATGAKSRGVIARDDLTGFNWSSLPVILIEMGFMSNPDEDRKLNSDKYQQKLVRGMIQGLNRYFDEKQG